MFRSLSRHSKGLLITAAGVITVSPDGLLTRLIPVDSLTITFWRSAFFSVGMLLLLTAYYRKNIVAAFLGIGVPGICMALLYVAGNIGFIYSVTHTTVANTLLLISTTPFWAALISWMVFREKVAMRTWVAIFATAIGVFIICDGPSAMPDANMGNLAGLFAASTLAMSFTIVARNRDRDLLPSFVLGGVLAVILLYPFVTPAVVSQRDLGYLFVMGFLMLPIAASLMFIGPKYISAPEVSLMMLLESILGPLWVWLVLREHPGDYAIIGGAIVLLTLAVHAAIGLVGNFRGKPEMVPAISSEK